MQVSLKSGIRNQESERFLLRHFSESLDALLSPSSPTLLAVALSGGADSVALALLADDYARAHGGQIIALTVDHGLRADSKAEAAQVGEWMRARGIAHRVLTPPLYAAAQNTQESARMRRYDALAECCASHGILHCLVAHQAGDNRETLLHNKTRGNTPDGSAGIPRTRIYRGIRFLRPMLGFERAELENFLRSNHAAWVEDPSNENLKFARVRHRKMLQQNVAQNAALDAEIRKNAAARAARDEALAQAAIRCVRIDPLGFADIDLPLLLKHEVSLASQLMADCLRTISGEASRPRARDTERLMQALHHSFTNHTLHRCEIVRHGDRLRIAREPSRVASALTLTGRGTAFWDHRFRVRYTIPEGESYTLQALGSAGQKQLRHALPLATPSLWHLDTLVHVPYITPAPESLHLEVGFAPPKPLAPTPFW